jgi:hypothetical protein
VTAEPLPGEPGHDDPVEILRALPQEYREPFLAEYAAAVDHAQDPAGYHALAEMLRLWRLRVAAYTDPGYGDRLNAARIGDTTTELPAEQVIAG